jgi:hypothetical protein
MSKAGPEFLIVFRKKSAVLIDRSIDPGSKGFLYFISPFQFVHLNMIKSGWIGLLSLLTFLSSCKKEEQTIDVSKQWKVDYSGNLISGDADGQWIPLSFSAQEMNLFNALDTADLTGTVKPDSVTSASGLFPNPSSSEVHMIFSFNGGFNGLMEFKYVIVDSHLNIQEEGAFKIQATAYSSIPLDPSESNPVKLFPQIAPGDYRLYYSLSAENSPHFYTSWGNFHHD